MGSIRRRLEARSRGLRSEISLKQWFWYALAGMFLIRDLRGKDFPKSTQNDKMALIYQDFQIRSKDFQIGQFEEFEMRFGGPGLLTELVSRYA